MTGEHFPVTDFPAQWLVIFFYPKDRTPVCQSEVIAFSRAYHDFSDRDTEVIGISVDSNDTHLEWLAELDEDINFSLFSDELKLISSELGILNSEDRSKRATYILSPDGIIQYESVHPDNVARSVTEVLRVLDGIQSGETCLCE